MRQTPIHWRTRLLLVISACGFMQAFRGGGKDIQKNATCFSVTARTDFLSGH
jgi:hypothetical protein